MSCLGRAAVPVKRVWRGLSARLRLRRATGLGRLRKEVRTCEYSDVHVMWEMLSSSNGNKSSAGGGEGAAAAATGKGSRRGRGRAGRKAAAAAWHPTAARSDHPSRPALAPRIQTEASVQSSASSSSSSSSCAAAAWTPG